MDASFPLSSEPDPQRAERQAFCAGEQGSLPTSGPRWRLSGSLRRPLTTPHPPPPRITLGINQPRPCSAKTERCSEVPLLRPGRAESGQSPEASLMSPESRGGESCFSPPSAPHPTPRWQCRFLGSLESFGCGKVSSVPAQDGRKGNRGKRCGERDFIAQAWLAQVRSEFWAEHLSGWQAGGDGQSRLGPPGSLGCQSCPWAGPSFSETPGDPEPRPAPTPQRPRVRSPAPPRPAPASRLRWAPVERLAPKSRRPGGWPRSRSWKTPSCRRRLLPRFPPKSRSVVCSSWARVCSFTPKKGCTWRAKRSRGASWAAGRKRTTRSCPGELKPVSALPSRDVTGTRM